MSLPSYNSIRVDCECTNPSGKPGQDRKTKEFRGNVYEIGQEGKGTFSVADPVKTRGAFAQGRYAKDRCGKDVVVDFVRFNGLQVPRFSYEGIGQHENGKGTFTNFDPSETLVQCLLSNDGKNASVVAVWDSIQLAAKLTKQDRSTLGKVSRQGEDAIPATEGKEAVPAIKAGDGFCGWNKDEQFFWWFRTNIPVRTNFPKPKGGITSFFPKASSEISSSSTALATSAPNEGSASESSSKKRHADESSSGETPRSKRKTLFTTATADILVNVFPHLSTKPVTLKNLSTDLWATLPKAQKASGWLPQAMHTAAAPSVAHSVAQPDEALALFSNFTFGQHSTASITETAAL